MSPRNHLSSRSIPIEPNIDYANWSNEALLARKRELQAMMPEYFPMPATETEETAYIVRVFREVHAKLRQADPMSTTETDVEAFIQRLLHPDQSSAPSPSTDGNQLIHDVSQFIARYLHCSTEQRTVLAFWVLHTGCFQAAPVTPYLSLQSAQPQSGKTLCLQLLSLLVEKPSLTCSLTASGLMRRMNTNPPSALLLDESQSILGTQDRPKAPSLRALLATSYHAQHGRMAANDDEHAFCPKAFALTGQLPDGLNQLSLPIILQPLPRNDNDGRWFSSNGIQRFHLTHAAKEAEALRQRLSAWSQQHLPQLEQLPPCAEEDFPQHLSGLNPRRMQLIEPLLQLADLVAGPWPSLLRKALEQIFTQGEDFRLFAHRQLLQDLHFCFSLQGFPERLSTAFLLDWLHALQNRPWQVDGPINAHKLARLLGAFEIMPRVNRMGQQQTARGYQLADFQDAWRRYLGVEIRRGPDGRSYPVTLAAERQPIPPPVTQEPQEAAPEPVPQISPHVNEDAACNGVALPVAQVSSANPKRSRRASDEARST